MGPIASALAQMARPDLAAGAGDLGVGTMEGGGLLGFGMVALVVARRWLRRHSLLA